MSGVVKTDIKSVEEAMKIIELVKASQVGTFWELLRYIREIRKDTRGLTK